jgi:hypothetical protein
MGKFREALDDADASVKVDASWVKGYYRQALAHVGLKQFEQAEESLQKILKLDPNNKAAKLELGKMDKRKAEYAAVRKLEAEQEALRQEENKPQIISKKIVENPQKAPAAPGKKKGSKEEDLSMKGYRTLADGRKTTFFNRELSEEDKALLAKNAGPKQVASTEDIAKQEAKLQKDGASAWNQGGTFEERTMTEWAVKRIKELVNGLEVSVPVVDGDGDVLEEPLKVVELADLEGDASITFTRGKKRHIFDFSFVAKWQIQAPGKTIKGGIFFPDVSGDVVVDDDLLEFELRWTNRDQAGPNQAKIKSALEDKKSGLFAKINSALHSFATEFRAIA